MINSFGTYFSDGFFSYSAWNTKKQAVTSVMKIR